METNSTTIAIPPNWSEEDGPESLEECILPLRLRSLFHRLVQISRFPHIVLTGPPGIGKSTIAPILAKEAGMLFHHIASPNYLAGSSLHEDVKQVAFCDQNILSAYSLKRSCATGLIVTTKNSAGQY